MDAAQQKRNGVHYTPRLLAQFLAEKTAALVMPTGRIDVLDPACGDGMLLGAFLETRKAGRESSVSSLGVHGFDTDDSAIEATRRRLVESSPDQVWPDQACLQLADFLDFAEDTSQRFDVVIANPPYVRTQVLGEKESRALANRFQLSGRVDLYHAFVAAINRVLKPGGVMGLLTSNRFLTTRAGGGMRKLLDEQFELRAVYDFGDTRLFDAAVLPAIVIALKKPADSVKCQYLRVYQAEFGIEDSLVECNDLFQAMDDDSVSKVSTPDGCYLIERGQLLNSSGAWSLSNCESQRWLSKVRAKQDCRFGDVAEIKVGVKTTADSVFIREDWKGLEEIPEAELLCPLITHHDAERWFSTTTRKQVLYPYDRLKIKRTPVELGDFPKAESYLEGHREKLAGRKYLRDAGREWFEIWVAQKPSEWAAPKIVWPDISEQPRFFLDQTGAVVNGDCYWIKLKPGVSADWVYLMLAVANSSLAVRYYDTLFHNKLYAGRRRFMTQYVSEFPLPDLESKTSQQIVGLVKQIVEDRNIDSKTEALLETLVSNDFGLGADV